MLSTLMHTCRGVGLERVSGNQRSMWNRRLATAPSFRISTMTLVNVLIIGFGLHDQRSTADQRLGLEPCPRLSTQKHDLN